MYKGFGKQYSLEIETLMVLNFNRLSEKERRHCASLEVIKLGYGSKTYIQNLFNIGQKTLERGIMELNNPELYAQIAQDKQRRAGGGRKKILQAMSNQD
jgi:predicted HTH transcriptional regulator